MKWPTLPCLAALVGAGSAAAASPAQKAPAAPAAASAPAHLPRVLRFLPLQGPYASVVDYCTASARPDGKEVRRRCLLPVRALPAPPAPFAAITVIRQQHDSFFTDIQYSLLIATDRGVYAAQDIGFADLGQAAYHGSGAVEVLALVPQNAAPPLVRLRLTQLRAFHDEPDGPGARYDGRTEVLCCIGADHAPRCTAPVFLGCPSGGIIPYDVSADGRLLVGLRSAAAREDLLGRCTVTGADLPPAGTYPARCP